MAEKEKFINVVLHYPFMVGSMLDIIVNAGYRIVPRKEFEPALKDEVCVLDRTGVKVCTAREKRSAFSRFDLDQIVVIYGKDNVQSALDFKALLDNKGILFGERSETANVPRELTQSAHTIAGFNPRSLALASSIQTSRCQFVDAANILSLDLTDYLWDPEALACYKVLGLTTFSDLTQKTAEDLLNVRGFGQVTLQKVEAELARYGLTLKKAPCEKSCFFFNRNPQEDRSYSPRVLHGFKALGVKSYFALIRKTPADFLAAEGFDKESLDELESRLSKEGLSLHSRLVISLKPLKGENYNWQPAAKAFIRDRSIRYYSDFTRFTEKQLRNEGGLYGLGSAAIAHVIDQLRKEGRKLKAD